MREKAKVMSAEEMRRALIRIAHEILEKDHKTIHNLILIGIRKRGDHLAKRVAKIIGEVEGIKMPVGAVDVSLYRDDLDLRHAKIPVNRTDIPFEVIGRPIVLFDDVLYTGRTTRAAMEAIIDFGRPAAIQLAVLIDRGHRELPIAADYVGKNIPTSRKEIIRVDLVEIDDVDQAVICED